MAAYPATGRHLACAAMCLALAPLGSAQVTSLYSDDFDTTNHVIYQPGDYTVVTEAIFGSDVLQTGHVQNNVSGQFASTTLSAGQSIVLRFDYRYTGAPTLAGGAGTFLRFGLYNSGGTIGGIGDTVYADDIGYLADLTYHAFGTPSAGEFGGGLRVEDSGDLGFSTTFDTLLLDQTPQGDNDILDAHPEVAAKTMVDGTSIHTAALQIAFDGSNLYLMLHQDDGSLASPLAVYEDTVYGVTTFDAFYLRVAGDLDSHVVQIDNLEVFTQATPIPEPAAAAGLAAGVALGLVGFRRRRVG